MGFATVGGEGQFRELELGALAPGVVSRIAEVVDQVMCGAIIDGKTIAMTLKLQAMLEEEQ